MKKKRNGKKMSYKKTNFCKNLRQDKLEDRGRPQSWMGGPESLSIAKKEQKKRMKVGIQHVIVRVTSKTGQIRYWLGKPNLVSSLRERYSVEIVK